MYEIFQDKIYIKMCWVDFYSFIINLDSNILVAVKLSVVCLGRKYFLAQFSYI